MYYPLEEEELCFKLKGSYLLWQNSNLIGVYAINK